MVSMSRRAAEAWQVSWDRQQEGYLPDREERFQTMLDVVATVADGEPPAVLDIAGGTGSISRRVLQRFPAARTTLLDVDPVLLAIANASLDDRTTIVSTNLNSADWRALLDRTDFDAVLTATAMHWIEPERLAALYAEIREVLRPGGVFINADHMPDDGLPKLSAQISARQDQEQALRTKTGAVLSWDGWWDLVAADADLSPLLAERAKVFADRHPEETSPPVSWHLQALRDAGFSEVGIVWRGGNDAAVVGSR